MKEKNKTKMNLDKFAQIVQKEFSGIQDQFLDIRKEMATKADLTDLKENMREEMRLETVKILRGVDSILPKRNTRRMLCSTNELLTNYIITMVGSQS